MSNARQEIISALKGAGHAMSISQIMAAVERTDRNAVDQLLYKMRKAGELKLAGRGLYVVPGDGGKIGREGAAPVDAGVDLIGLDLAAGSLTNVEQKESLGKIGARSSPGQQAVSGWRAAGNRPLCPLRPLDAVRHGPHTPR